MPFNGSIGGFMDNLDMAKLMKLFSNVSKDDLNKSIEVANKIMKSENKDQIIEKLKNDLNNKNKSGH